MPEELNSPRSALTASGRHSGRWAALMLVALAGFGAGGSAVFWLVTHGEAGRDGWHYPAPDAAPTAAAPASPAPGAVLPALNADQSALETRISAAEQRLDRLDLQAAAAAGNAARAEGLLVAFAVRRVIERGAQLGYLEDQLKLRFGDAQPHAVSTLIASARTPVTLDMLVARLQVVAPSLTTEPASEPLWRRMQRELTDMFVIRRDTASGPSPAARLDHALACLREGDVDGAITDVRRLPDSDAAVAWIADAQRYADAERALDLIETTALLEPHTLDDGNGRKVAQPSPLAPPALAAPATTPTATAH